MSSLVLEVKMQMLSVVVPCYNEQEVIEETYRQLTSELESIARHFSMDYELIFVNDGSRDHTLSLLHKIESRHRSEQPLSRGKIKVLALARNFGHQLALSAGLSQASGDAIVAIDADLQDPPAVISRMLELWQQGVDVAYGMRDTREGESWFKILSAKLFYLVVRRLTRINIPLDTGDFRLMSRRALDVFNAMPERNRFIRGMIPWIGFRQEAVTYARAKRFAGSTKYPLSKMIRLALDGITSFSNAPLQTAFLAGLLIAFFSVFYAIYIVIREIIFGFPVQGWSSIMVAILFIGSVQLVTIVILGEYVGRIYD